MSQEEQKKEEPKKQEEATSDKKSGSTKATIEAPKKASSSSNKALIIDQVRSELEQYFAPQNIQNDFNLRQSMTTDGYIDIDLLLDLKLMQDLVSSRDILIEAISRSKLLVMNTGCTMVKYMPLLERNVLILRDIPSSTEKEEIMAIFSNEECSTPSEVHSDIGNNWFCRFKTEEECLQTAKYLQQFGVFKESKLHVRVKAILDKNKADTSPQMAPSPQTKPTKIPPQNAIPSPPLIGAYPQEYYQSGGYGYYGQNTGYDYYGSPKTKAKEVTPPDKGDKPGDDERTAMSDYPGVFDKYTQEEFLEIYGGMKENELGIPQGMRGRDFRIISEEVLIPMVLQRKEKGKEEDMDDKKKKEKQKKKKKKEKEKEKEQPKREISGTYYEEDVYDEPYYEYDAYYYQEQSNAKGSYYYNYESAYYNYDYDDGYYDTSQRKQRQRQVPKQPKQQQQKKRGSRARQYQSQRNNRNQPQRSNWKQRGSKPSGNGGGVHWSPRQAKVPKVLQYNTNKGVYRTKVTTTSTSSAY